MFFYKYYKIILLSSIGLTDNFTISGKLITTYSKVLIFTVSKNQMDFEVLVDGEIEVRPIRHQGFNEETLMVLATMHQVVIEWYWVKNDKQYLPELALDYFRKRGFEIKKII